MHTVVVIGTGGTIATRRDADGANRAVDDGAALVSQLALDPKITIRTQDVFVRNSFLVGPREMLELAHAVQDALTDPAVAGVVVTHGTDTMEESAYLLDLVHHDQRPVVLTGAQRAADAPDFDGVRNLTDAITVAADPHSRGIGVLICFDGLLFPARLTRKTQTMRSAAFSTPDAGPLGRIGEGRLVLQTAPVRTEPLDLDQIDLSDVRVDIAAFYPGADSTALRAFVDAGATGLVLEAMKGKLDGTSLRVPVPTGSITDFVGTLNAEASADDVNAAFRAAAEGPMKGILVYSEDPLVSSDIVGTPASCTFDSGLTMAIGNMVKVLGWYDNEWGYSNRTVDLVQFMGEKL